MYMYMYAYTCIPYMQKSRHSAIATYRGFILTSSVAWSCLSICAPLSSSC